MEDEVVRSILRYPGLLPALFLIGKDLERILCGLLSLGIKA